MKNFFILLFTLFCTTLSAQKAEAGLYLGSIGYYGDIDVYAGNAIRFLRPAIGVLGKYHLNRMLVLRGGINYGRLYATDRNHPQSAWRSTRGFSFNTDFVEANLMGEVEWLSVNRDFRFDRDDKFLTYYTFGGFSYSYFNPKTDFNEPNPYFSTESINKDKLANYSQTTAAYGAGVGLKIDLGSGLILAAETRFMLTFSDYLDGISKSINSKDKDKYFFSGLTLTKAFGGEDTRYLSGFRRGNVICPKF